VAGRRLGRVDLWNKTVVPAAAASSFSLVILSELTINTLQIPASEGLVLPSFGGIVRALRINDVPYYLISRWLAQT
jgi:hypothetical protein